MKELSPPALPGAGARHENYRVGGGESPCEITKIKV